MPMIPGFPQPLLEEHKRWHHARHSVDPSRPPAGYGLDFLSFHRAFVRKVRDWYAQSGLDPRLIEPWASVPEPIRQAVCYDLGAEDRILRRPETFSSTDELGRFIEGSGIHGCIHQEAAALYGEPLLNDFDNAPASTVFYNIHGLIDRWWLNWEGLGRFGEGMPYWSGRFYRSEAEVLHYRREDSSWWLGMAEEKEDRAAADEVRLDWGAIGESGRFGPLDDGRPFRVWDSDGDGRLEVLFQSPDTGEWWEGSLRDGRLEWKAIRLENVGLPSQAGDSLRAKPRRKRKTPT